MLPCPDWTAAAWARFQRHTDRRPRLSEEPLTREIIAARWRLLSQREREAVRLYFGVDATPGGRPTYRRVGEHLGICESRVWQLVHSGLRKLSGNGRGH